MNGRIMLHTPANNRFPICAALIPFVLAIVFSLLGTRPAPATVSLHRPAIAFAEYVARAPYSTRPAPVLWGRFQFTNRGDTDIVFMKQTPSCGCMNPEFFAIGSGGPVRCANDKVWSPGECGDLFIKVQTTGQKPGPHEYTLRMEYGAPDSSVDERTEVTLAYKAIIPEQKISVEPRALLVYQLGDGATEHEVVVSDMRGTSLKIESFEVHSPMVSVKQLDETVSPAGWKKIRLQVRIEGQAPAGDSRALVTMQTNDERFPVLQIPIMIKGPRRPATLALHAEPSLLMLSPAADDATQLVGELQLVNAEGKPLKVRSVHADPAVIQAGHSTNGNGQGTITISASVPMKNVTSFNRGMLTIETDEPDRSRLEVPITWRNAKGKSAAIEVGPPALK
ncbi:DUF1573 domain-containing protein [bacterium]|nr:DUF1573 domain-containing protein [bacterium]